MLRARLLVLALAAAPLASCTKEPANGLPPVGDSSRSSAGARGERAVTAQPASTSASTSVAAAASPHGGGGDPHAGHGGGAAFGAQRTRPRALERLADGRVGLGPFSLAVPAGWTEQPITSSMRAAHLVLPAAPGAEAELVVYYFGERGAGSVKDNFDRWIAQFQLPDGRPAAAAAKIEHARFAGQTASVVAVSGRYATSGMPGVPAVDRADQGFIGAIVDSPRGPYYFKLVGAKATVDAHAAHFRALLASLQVR